MNWRDFDYEKWQEENAKFDHAKYDAMCAVADAILAEEEETIAYFPELPKEMERPPWKPEPFYNVDGDGIELYLSDDCSYTKWLCPGVEVKLSIETDEIVGINIWGVKKRIAEAEEKQ